MRFLEYLFFKYYNWQIKVGNGDIPSFMSVFCITFSLFLYGLNLTMVYGYFIASQVGTVELSEYLFVILTTVVFLILYLLLVSNGRDLAIMEKHKEEWTGKKNLGAILFPIIAFIWFNANNIIKILMNRGVL